MRPCAPRSAWTCCAIRWSGPWVAARTLSLGGAGPRTLRIADITGPRFGWSVLAERPGRELVLATLARPWRLGAPPPAQPATPEGFVAFAEPGHVKIFLAVRAVPQGPAATVLTVETRVAATDPAGSAATGGSSVPSAS
jgi:hypothetical protein